MKKIILFLACGILLGNLALAQTTKFGYIDSRELLSVMPDKIKADTAIAQYARTFQDQLQQMGKEYEKKVKDFQGGEKTMTDAMKEVKAKEIQDLQRRIEETNQSAQEKVEKKRQELYQPVLEKADKAIKEVAKEKGYDYVFDASTGALLQARETDNILGFVKAKLGIK
jgi:outer membrane protein